MAELTVLPQELKFRFELRKAIPVLLTLSNSGNEKVAFKVKTTSPKKYCVRPSSGIIEPGSSKDVQVIMQAQREFPPSLEDVTDKFLVQYTAAPGAREVGPNTFDTSSNNNIKQTKLRVVLVGPPKPPSPVPEGVEEEASPARGAHRTGDAALASQRGGDSGSRDRERSLESQLLKVQKDKADLKKRLDLAELQVHSRGHGSPQAQAASGYSTWLVLLLAVLAFLAGKYFSASIPQLVGGPTTATEL